MNGGQAVADVVKGQTVKVPVRFERGGQIVTARHLRERRF